MSSVIRDFNQLRDQEISGLKKQVARERRAMEEVHQKNKAEIKQTQEREIVELRDDHAQRISEEHERREKVLAELEKNLNHTKDVTEKQLKDLKTKTREQENKIEDDHAQRRLLLNANNEQYLQETDYRYNSQLKKISMDGENRIHQTKEDLALKHNEVKDQLENKLQQTRNHYQAELSRQDHDFEARQKLKQHEFKTKETELRQNHENKIVEQTQINQDLYQKRGDDYRNKFQEQDNFFEKKFENQLSSHHSQLKGLDQKFEEISNQLKTDLMTKIEAVKKKEDDIFFEFTELESKTKDLGDHYQVEVKVPEYAKNDLRLTTNNKEIVLTLNRRYQDHVEKDGIKHKVNKVETLSSRIVTQDHLNPKKITSHYDDGVMTYKIQKA